MGSMTLSMRSREQFIRKVRNGAAAYEATDPAVLDPSTGIHWRTWGRMSDEDLAEMFLSCYCSAYPDEDETLVRDPAPVRR